VASHQYKEISQGTGRGCGCGVMVYQSFVEKNSKYPKKQVVTFVSLIMMQFPACITFAKHFYTDQHQKHQAQINHEWFQFNSAIVFKKI
jgi:hypothetical protein